MLTSIKHVYFGIGSSLGNRWGYLSLAVNELALLDQRLVASPIFETTPVGGPQGQGPYLNCVVEMESVLSPLELLGVAHRIEQLAKRERIERFGDRTLDIDVLLIDHYESDDPVLTVPHPRMWERAFVLAPLEEIAPNRVPDDWRERLGHPGDLGIAKVGELVRSIRS